MKKIFTLAALSLLFQNYGFSQKRPVWFDLAITGSGGGCLLTSKNLFHDTKTVTSSPAFCYAFGGKFGINFNESHELAFNTEYYCRQQSYAINMDSVKFNKSIALKGVDFALLYRNHGKESSGYLEIGPQISLISVGDENRDGSVNDILSQFQHSYISGVFGFGSNIVVSNAFTWTAGFRFTYSFTDLISNDGGRGNMISYPLNDSGASKKFDSYAAFSATTLQIHTEFTFDLGYFTKSKCKRGRISFLRFK